MSAVKAETGPIEPPLALHTWTLGPRLLPDVLAIAERAGYPFVEINFEDLARCRAAGLDAAELARLIADGPVAVCVVGVEPGWLFAEAGEAARLRDRFRQTAETALTLGCSTVMTALGRNSGPLPRAEEAIARFAADARAIGVRLAMEFNSGHPAVPTLADAQALLRCAGAGCGLVIDTYHLHRAGAVGAGFASVPAEDIAHVQFSDVPPTPPPEGVALDRLPPGEGGVLWHEALHLLLVEKGYRGPLSYEAPNPVLWARPPDEVAAEGRAAVRRLIAEATGTATPGSRSTG